MSSSRFDQSPLQQITRADGIAKEIRIHDGHLFVCQGCCCGRTGAASNFGDVREIRLVLAGPYLRTPPTSLNLLGIPDKPHYRTADACALLGIKPELFRYRLYTGKYPEVKRDGKGRLFSLEDLNILMGLSQQRRRDRQSK